jgi:heme exporter protein D
MNWSSVSEFLAMGGYGFYVWGSFGMAAIVIVAELLALRARRKALLQAPRMDEPAHAEFTRSAHEA